MQVNHKDPISIISWSKPSRALKLAVPVMKDLHDKGNEIQLRAKDGGG